MATLSDRRVDDQHVTQYPQDDLRDEDGCEDDAAGALVRQEGVVRVHLLVTAVSALPLQEVLPRVVLRQVEHKLGRAGVGGG